jgi:hypothetical protein
LFLTKSPKNPQVYAHFTRKDRLFLIVLPNEEQRLGERAFAQVAIEVVGAYPTMGIPRPRGRGTGERHPRLSKILVFYPGPHEPQGPARIAHPAPPTEQDRRASPMPAKWWLLSPPCDDEPAQSPLRIPSRAAQGPCASLLVLEYLPRRTQRRDHSFNLKSRI